jgi:tetratricopeptide (TPR) repeat protein
LTEANANPEELAEQALEAYQAGDYERAVQEFADARDLFQASGNKLRAAEMNNNLSVCLLQLDQVEEALAAVRETPNVFHNEDAILLKAQALGNRAMAKAALGQSAEAEADYRTAAKLFSEIGDEEGLQYTMQALSRIQLQQGRPIEALHAMESVLDAKTKPSLRDRFLSWLFKFPRRFLGR